MDSPPGLGSAIRPCQRGCPYLQWQGLLAVPEAVIQDNSSPHIEAFGILDYVILKDGH